jgi:hypothetical protein
MPQVKSTPLDALALFRLMIVVYQMDLCKMVRCNNGRATAADG